MKFSIVMPAYKAGKTIAASVRSALAQTHGDFELVVSADDQQNYADLLAADGVEDPRLLFTQTDGVGTGSSNARNVGMEMANERYIVVLDADDLLHPQKLEILAKHIEEHPVITTGLQVTDELGTPLRQVGTEGADGILAASNYKQTNISMDSMVSYDRQRIPAIYDVELPCLVDLGLMLEMFCHSDEVLHIAQPLHFYAKQQNSISNGDAASERYVRIKNLLLERLESGYYPLAGGNEAVNGLCAFLRASLAAEKTYPERKIKSPDVLFEDHLQSYL